MEVMCGNPGWNILFPCMVHAIFFRKRISFKKLSAAVVFLGVLFGSVDLSVISVTSD